jgi:hypothetical protein
MPVFESPDGGNTVYSREPGSDKRELIKTYDLRTHDGRPLHEHMMEDKMWGEIRKMAKTNPTLQEALERVIMIYKLIKPNER